MNFKYKYILFLFLSIMARSQDVGSLTGVIKESGTGVALPGVNIMIKGTYYGTATDTEGRYRIDKISPGSYDIQVSMIGYKVILKTGTSIVANEVINIDFTMEETVLSFGEDVVVLGKKPLFDVDETWFVG